MDLFQAFALLFTGSLAVLLSLALLVMGRKVLRDRRESASAQRRRRYRQWLAVVRTHALLTMLRPDNGWGEMTRVGFAESAPALTPVRSPAPVDAG